MAENGIPIAGKNPSGKKVDINVNANGDLQTTAVSASGVAQGYVGDAMSVEPRHIGGERGEDDAATSYMVTSGAGLPIRADIGTTETVIAAYPCIVEKIIGNDSNTGFVSLRNAAATGGASTPISLPNVADGACIDTGMIFTNGLTAQGEALGCDVTFVIKAVK